MPIVEVMLARSVDNAQASMAWCSGVIAEGVVCWISFTTECLVKVNVNLPACAFLTLTRPTTARITPGRGTLYCGFTISSLQHATMPPPRLQTSQDEGNILLAMSAFQSNQFPSIAAAARAFNISKSSLYYRIHGRTSREEYTPTNKKMSKIEEEVLVKEILKLDS